MDILLWSSQTWQCSMNATQCSRKEDCTGVHTKAPASSAQQWRPSPENRMTAETMWSATISSWSHNEKTTWRHTVENHTRTHTADQLWASSWEAGNTKCKGQVTQEPETRQPLANNRLQWSCLLSLLQLLQLLEPKSEAVSDWPAVHVYTMTLRSQHGSRMHDDNWGPLGTC